MTAPLTAADARAALKDIEPVARSLQMFSTDSEGMPEKLSVGMRRRRVRAGEPDPVSTVALVVNEEGVLLWREGGAAPRATERRRVRGVARAGEGELVELYQYEKLEPNRINRFLSDLDNQLNNQHGLQRLTQGSVAGVTGTALSAVTSLEGKKRRLLLIHGTFSKSEALLHGIRMAQNGSDFLRRVLAYYDEVLVFEHPTLSVGPVLNACDLYGMMKAASGPLDIVAHSRGGLVTRWFLEGFGPSMAFGPCRAVLVGSPLGGTSLASPPRLRDSLSFLSNFGTVLRTGGAAAIVYQPLLAAPLALLKIATSVVSGAASVPLLDAAVSMIPGLAAQSRVDLNHELARLRGFSPTQPPTYFVVRSNFETDRPGWKFWEWFRADKLKDVAADKVFPGPNDLVVDTPSMSEFVAVSNPPATFPAARVHDFKTNGTVHHTNYFEQEATLEFILAKLGVP